MGNNGDCAFATYLSLIFTLAIFFLHWNTWCFPFRPDCVQILQKCRNSSAHLASKSAEEVCDELSPPEEQAPCISLKEYLGGYLIWHLHVHCKVSCGYNRKTGYNVPSVVDECEIIQLIFCERWINLHDTSLAQGKKNWVLDRNRTHDLPNTRGALYPLSYENSWRARLF